MGGRWFGRTAPPAPIGVGAGGSFTAADWSPRSPKARTCSPQRQGATCNCGIDPTTKCATRRKDKLRETSRRPMASGDGFIRARCTAGACRTMPLQNGQPIQQAGRRACWAKLVALYKAVWPGERNEEIHGIRRSVLHRNTVFRNQKRGSWNLSPLAELTHRPNARLDPERPENGEEIGSVRRPGRLSRRYGSHTVHHFSERAIRPHGVPGLI